MMSRRAKSTTWTKKGLPILCAAALGLAGGLRVGAQEVVDLVDDGPVIDLRLDGPFQNPLVGFRVEAEARRVGGRFSVTAEAGWSPSVITDYEVLPLFGSDGARLRLAGGYMLGEQVRSERRFHAVTEVGRTSSTVTYAGFYFMQPSHESHWLELDARLEPTGTLSLRGYDSETLAPVYGLARGYSFFLFPRYRYTWESRYRIEELGVRQWGGIAHMAVGPMFTPDFRRVGGAMEASVGFNTAGFNLYTSIMLGLVVRTDLSDGMSIFSPDSPGETLTLGEESGDDSMVGMMLAYLPIRLSIGVSYSFDPRKNGGGR